MNPVSDIITTDEVGKVFENVYSDLDMGNAHIEYFYLFVQAKTMKNVSSRKKLEGGL